MTMAINVREYQRHQIPAVRDRLAAEAEEILNRAEGVLSEDDQARYDEILADLKALKQRDEQLARLEEALANPHAQERAQMPVLPATGQPSFLHTLHRGELRPVQGRADRPKGIPSLLPSAEALSALFSAVQQRQSLRLEAGLETRAAVLTTTTGADQMTTELGQRPRAPRRIVFAAGVPIERVSGIERAAFPVFGEGDADITPEGQTKTEYSAITPGSVRPQVISIWTDTSRQNLLTMTSFEAKLRTVLAAKVARREDALVASTVLNTTGILQVTGPVDPDSLLEAAGLIASGEVAAEPNLVLVNPADLPAVVGTSVGTGGSASPDFSQFLPAVHGMRIYPTAAVAAGTALVGAWTAGAIFVVGMEPAYLVDAVSGIKTNTVTILLEEAVALAVEEPQAFCKISAA